MLLTDPAAVSSVPILETRAPSIAELVGEAFAARNRKVRERRIALFRTLRARVEHGQLDAAIDVADELGLSDDRQLRECVLQIAIAAECRATLATANDLLTHRTATREEHVRIARSNSDQAEVITLEKRGLRQQIDNARTALAGLERDRDRLLKSAEESESNARLVEGEVHSDLEARAGAYRRQLAPLEAEIATLKNAWPDERSIQARIDVLDPMLLELEQRTAAALKLRHEANAAAAHVWQAQDRLTAILKAYPWIDTADGVPDWL